MSETLRNLQYLKTLKNQRAQKMDEVREIDSQISHLRKNPTDKLTNDLLVYQYNKKKEILKQDISSIDKEIYRLNANLENFDTSVLDDSQLQEFYEEIVELHPVEEVVEEPAVEEPPVTIEKKENNFKALIKSFFDTRKLIVCGLSCLALLWVFFTCDRLNLLGVFNKYTRFKFFSFLLLGIFVLTVSSVYAYKDINKKPLGAFSDYFMLVCLVLSLGTIVLDFIQSTQFKLLLAMALAVYSLVYFVFRLALYGKDIKQTLAKKSRVVNYYYDLFSKYPLIVLAMLFIVSLSVLYLSMTLNMVTGWLQSTKGHKPYMIISLIILGLFILYMSALSVIRIKEKETKIIDLYALTVEVVSIEFFFLTRFIATTIGNIFYIIFALLFVSSLALTIYRIIRYKND